MFCKCFILHVTAVLLSNVYWLKINERAEYISFFSLTYKVFTTAQLTCLCNLISATFSSLVTFF